MMGSFGMGFMWIILIIVIIAVIVFAKGYFSPPKKQSGPIEESALEVLKKRYASGEIGKEEFDEMKKDLM